MRVPAKKKTQRATPPLISAVVSAHIRLETHPDGNVFACFDDYALELGKFSGAAALRAQQLRTGLPLKSFAAGRNAVDKEVDLLVRRLARRGLLEYRLGHEKLGHKDGDQVVIEPQMPDYWPRTPKLAGSDRIVLSRFAYLRRRGNEMILESPRAGALFRICDPKIAAALSLLATPRTINKLRRQDGFPGTELFALLLDCRNAWREVKQAHASTFFGRECRCLTCRRADALVARLDLAIAADASHQSQLRLAEVMA